MIKNKTKLKLAKQLDKLHNEHSTFEIQHKSFSIEHLKWLIAMKEEEIYYNQVVGEAV